MNNYLVRPVNEACVNFLVREHYLGKWPGVPRAVLGMFDGLEPIGCIVFALPPVEIMTRFGVSVAWELARLFIRDCTPKCAETWFMSRAIRWVKHEHPEVELLVSYADPAHGHNGTIYRAGNWIEDGKTDQDRKSPRFDIAVQSDTLFGPIEKRYGRASHVPLGAQTVRIRRSSKFRFVYWMRGHERRRQEAAASPPTPEEIAAAPEWLRRLEGYE